MPAEHALVRCHMPVHPAPLRRIAVARRMNVVDIERKTKPRQQLPREDDGPAHDDKQQRIGFREAGLDVRRQTLDRRLYLTGIGDQVGAFEKRPGPLEVRHCPQ